MSYSHINTKRTSREVNNDMRKGEEMALWRTETARTSCNDLNSYLQNYIDANFSPKKAFFAKAKRYLVKEIKGLQELGRDGVLLLVGFTGSTRIEAEPIVAKRRLVTQAGFRGSMFFVVLRFGEKAMPAKIEDDKFQEVGIADVPSLNVHYDSKSLILNEATKNSINHIMAAFG